MQVFDTYKDIPESAKGCVLALGNFDGVHLGHRHVIEVARVQAQKLGAPLGVMTFEPHPRQMFRIGDPPFRLTLPRMKEFLIAALGVDFLFVLHFDHAFSQIQAEDFVLDILSHHLKAKHVVVGHDFVFGHQRRGNVQMLRSLQVESGVEVTEVAPVTVGKTLVSSSVIREALRVGKPQEAAALLGRPWVIEGIVQRGDQRGRMIGFPTANIALCDYLRPQKGVYAVRTNHGIGVANLGNRPTFDGEGVLLEVHLFDFNGDLYDQRLEVELIEFLRAEQKFAGIEALKEQISKDCDRARQILQKLESGALKSHSAAS